MDVTLMNPTNEEFQPYYGGKALVFAPGSKKRVDGPVGAHCMNNYEQRGLISLDYDDNITTSPHDKNMTIEEWKIVKGKRLNKEFKTKQIAMYNQQNEKRKQENMSFLDPTPQVKAYSKELGLELLSPYTTIDRDQTKLNDAKEENETLRKANLKLQDSMTALLEKVDQLIAGKEVTKEDVTESLATADGTEQYNESLCKRFRNLGKDNFKNFVKDNMSEIKAWPEEVKTKVRERHTKDGHGELII